MFGSEVLDVAIGLVFLYLILSLICSAACELIESFLKRRSRYLRLGLQELLNDPGGSGLVKAIYTHPLVSSLYRGDYNPYSSKNLPSYIPARNFALAMMDIILSPGFGPGFPAALGAAPYPSPPASGQSAPSYSSPFSSPTPGPFPGYTPPPVAPDWPDWLRNAIMLNLGQNPQTQQALITLGAAAGFEPQKLRENLENWYNSSMDRVSGWFKRASHYTVIILAILIAAALNADTISITNSLATDKSLRAALISAATEATKPKPEAPLAGASASSAAPAAPSAVNSPIATAPLISGSGSNIAACRSDPASAECRFQANLRQIQSTGLPLGWALGTSVSATDARRVPGSMEELLMKILGLALTVLAISLGGPFWFDMLSRLMVVRSTVKPKEKSTDEPAPGLSSGSAP